jgi:hypothetical protein
MGDAATTDPTNSVWAAMVPVLQNQQAGQDASLPTLWHMHSAIRSSLHLDRAMRWLGQPQGTPDLDPLTSFSSHFAFGRPSSVSTCSPL